MKPTYNLRNGNIVKKIARSNKEPNYWTTSVKQDEPKIWEADMSKTKSSFNLSRISVESGLKATFDWFVSNKHLYD